MHHIERIHSSASLETVMGRYLGLFALSSRQRDEIELIASENIVSRCA